MHRSGAIVGVFVGIFLVLTGVTWMGWYRQRAALRQQVDRLVGAGRREHAAVPDDPEFGTLPDPVARYLRLALPRRQRLREVRIRQSGTLRTETSSERWMPFEAEHIAVPAAAGFVWNARVGIAPLLHVRVRDAFIDGEGAGHVSLLSLFTVGSDAGTPEMNSGSLHRYLAEAVWYPTALLPSRNLKWSEIDAGAALATLTAHDVTVSLEFRFGEGGEVIGIYTPARWGSFAGGYRAVPWEGHFRDYREHDGVLVPMEGEVGWYVGDEWQAVWRGRITSYQLQSDAW